MTAEICNYVVPSLLYRYRSLRSFTKSHADVLDRELSAIEQHYLWCSDFKHLNDPMEGNFVTTSRVRASERFTAARQAVRNGKAGLGLCAFSETQNNELMWAHYAGEFSGICVAYRFARLRKGLPDECAFSRISYDDRPPKMAKPDGHDTSLANDVRKILSTKGYRWLYEREWRLFAPQPHRIDYRPSGRIVSTVYIGFRTPTRSATLIEQRMAAIGVRTRRMSLRRYTIEFDEPT